MKILLIGPHGVGKSTLGAALAAELRWPFHDEVGRHLAADPAFRPEGRGAEAPQAEFDLEVLAREIARDLVHDRGVGGPRIIEMWHPGNFAYASERSPDVAAAIMGYARAAFVGQETFAIPLRAPSPVLAARQSEPGSLEFFQRVAERSWSVALSLGASPLPAVWTHCESAEDIAARIAPVLRELAEEMDAVPARTAAHA